MTTESLGYIQHILGKKRRGQETYFYFTRTATYFTTTKLKTMSKPIPLPLFVADISSIFFPHYNCPMQMRSRNTINE